MWYNWLLLEELDVSAGGTVTGVAKKYTWGLDLAGQSGSVNDIESAGGIGGLLGTYDVGTSTSYIYFYDANGNVGQLLDASDGSVDAKYEYDAYGNLLTSDGDYADDNRFRFSTKYYHAETELYYFGYRYYLPRLGRWVKRDSLEEDGGANLQVYGLNAPTWAVDSLGERPITVVFGAFIAGPPAWLPQPLSRRWQFKTDNRGFGGGAIVKSR